MADKVRRDQIVALMIAGVSNKDIAKQLNVCRKTVHNAWKQYEQSGHNLQLPIPGWQRSIRTKSLIP